MSVSYALWKCSDQLLHVAVGDTAEQKAEDAPRKGLLGHSVPETSPRSPSRLALC